MEASASASGKIETTPAIDNLPEYDNYEDIRAFDLALERMEVNLQSLPDFSNLKSIRRTSTPRPSGSDDEIFIIETETLINNKSQGQIPTKTSTNTDMMSNAGNTDNGDSSGRTKESTNNAGKSKEPTDMISSAGNTDNGETTGKPKESRSEDGGFENDDKLGDSGVIDENPSCHNGSFALTEENSDTEIDNINMQLKTVVADMKTTEAKRNGILEEKQENTKEIAHLVTLLEAKRSRESDITKKLDAASTKLETLNAKKVGLKRRLSLVLYRRSSVARSEGVRKTFESKKSVDKWLKEVESLLEALKRDKAAEEVRDSEITYEEEDTTTSFGGLLPPYEEEPRFQKPYPARKKKLQPQDDMEEGGKRRKTGVSSIFRGFPKALQ